MSLFKSRDFWTTNSDLTNEEFDCSSLTLNKLNSESDFILCGSHMGVLRIYKPSCDTTKGTLCGYIPSDLYIEKHLASPILQIDSGRLVSGSPLIQLAILHPRSFAVYSFTTKQGATEQGNQNMVNLLYEHKLRRSAASFTIGQFGNTQNRDFIAVQSLDGMLSFFEQETFVFCCFLPDFLLPGCFVYAKRIDCFIITGSTLTIESYSYKNLSAIGQNSDENDAGGIKCQSDWSVNVSEHIMDLQYIYNGFGKESYVVALGERNLFCLKDSGKVKFMKRFDYSPIAMTTYLIDDYVMTMIVSETNTLLVYQNTSLKWSAQLQDLPVVIARGYFHNLRGVLVTLGESGNLRCSYLGTFPNLFQAPPMQSVELNYEEVDKELAELTKIIKDSHTVLKGGIPDNDLTIEAHVQNVDENCNSAIIEIILEPNVVFEEVNVTINVQKPLEAIPRSVFLDSTFVAKETLSVKVQRIQTLIDGEDESFDVIKSLAVDIIATCVSAIGMPKVLRKKVTLPAQLAFVNSTPQKENRIKIVLNISEAGISLQELFPEFGDVASPNTLALKANLLSPEKSETVTLLLAKSSSRYRVQCDTLAALNLPLHELVKRLKNHFKTNRNFKISYVGNLPLKELYQEMSDHYMLTRSIERMQLQIVEFGGQFRLIQKRLISKFKDRHPVPLNNLSMLLQDTYNEILSVTDELDKTYANLTKSQLKLENSLSVIALLLTLSNDNIDETIVESFMDAPVTDADGLQWEDMMDANVGYLLRTLLAKSDKDKLRGCAENYERVTDYAKFEKHFGAVIDRLLKKGVKLEEESEQADEELDELEKQETDDVVLPIGSKIAQSSSRVLSARQRKT